MGGQMAGPHFHRKKQKSARTVLEPRVHPRASPAGEIPLPGSALLPRLPTSTEVRGLLRT